MRKAYLFDVEKAAEKIDELKGLPHLILFGDENLGTCPVGFIEGGHSIVEGYISIRGFNILKMSKENFKEFMANLFGVIEELASVDQDERERFYKSLRMRKYAFSPLWDFSDKL